MTLHIEDTETALTLALHLAITAPTQEKADECITMAETFAAQLTRKEVDLCMKAAEAINIYQEIYNA